MAWRLAAVLCAALICWTGAALAQPTPRPKPAPDPVSRIMAETDFQTLRRAFDAVEAGQFGEARSLASTIADRDAQTLALWRLAREGNPGFSARDLANLLERLEGWPGESDVQAKLEEMFFIEGSTGAEMAAVLGARAPVSGDGVAARALILKSQGRAAEAEALAKEAWTTRRLSVGAARNLRNHFSFSREDHYQRADLLVWLKQWTEATSLLGQLDSGERALMKARMTIARGQRGADTALAAVPSRYADDPGLLYARALFKRRRGDWAGAMDVIKDAEAPDSLIGRELMWPERRIFVRRALREGEPVLAYAIASRHGLTDGIEFSEGAFLSGWIALRRLNDAAGALEHFEALTKGVSTPVSLARAHYWRGRALEALGERDKAEDAYADAAGQGPVFYAFLAREKLGMEPLYISSDGFLAGDGAEAEAFRQRGSVRALVMLGELGQRHLFRQFAYGMDDLAQSPQELAWIAEIAVEHLEPSVGVRAAKTGLRQGWVIPDALYPIAFEDPRVAGVEAALPLAIARQESEFDPFAISSARAYGMMQMIDSTARMTARRYGKPYDRALLLADPEYNIRLGASHLADLLAQYDGNVPMTAAAYNAGGGRVSQWVRDYGDPRDPDVDALDWIESIPFTETNNYVQRVLENLIVYRSRLAGGSAPSQLTAELKRSRETARGGP